MKTTKSTLTTALALTLALGLSACGSDDTPTTESPEEGVAVETPAGTGDDSPDTTTSADEATSTDESTATGTTTPADPDADLTDIALTAIRTAEAEAGGEAYEIDDIDDDGTWEVDVRVGDRSVEVTVDSEGTTVLETEDDDLDGEDRAALDAATVTLTEAIEIAIDEAGGVLDDAELETDDGRQAWEITVDTGEHDDLEVLVSVTGDVIKVDD